MKNLSVIAFLLMCTSLQVAAQLSNDIKVNQVGYFPNAPKHAVVVGTSATTFELRNASNTTVYTGNLGSTAYWDETSENVKSIDFTDFTETGSFKIYIDGVGESYDFIIANDALDQVSKEAVRYFYYNRSSFALEEQYAGEYKRAGGHWDTDVLVCDNSFPGGRSAGSTFSSPGGWYDAGDYNKYTLTAGISVYTLMSTYEQYPEYVSSLHLNLPESSNNIPDLLDECLYELNWLMTMQDSDGGVYQKVSNEWFGNFEMPDVHDANNGQRMACNKNTSATLQFAAAMAAAYRIYEDFDAELPVGTRASWKQAAVNAWNWAQTNKSVAAARCGCNNTGWYTDDYHVHEFQWAAIELYLATGDLSYYNTYNVTAQGIYVPNWASNQNTYGIISLLMNKDKLTGVALSDYNTLLNNYKGMANGWVSVYNNHPYQITMRDDWTWGSNGEASNRSYLVLTAYRLTEQSEYLETALGNIDYILGKNTSDYCWLTGFGSKKVMDAHHRASGADGIAIPVPGMVFGGPYATATGFEDNSCCGTEAYANTEVTINWNAPFAYTTVALQAIFGSVDGPFVLSTSPSSGGSISLSPDKAEYEKGEVVTVTAVPDNGFVFSGWGGAASGTELTTTITMNGNKSVSALFDEPYLWHSYNVVMQSGIPQATVSDVGGNVANVSFYESTNNGGVNQGALFSSYTAGSHGDGFNNVQNLWQTTDYPYVGKSKVVRGSDQGEGNAPEPLGVSDLGIHPPNNNHLTVCAFEVPEDGRYELSSLAVRNVSSETFGEGVIYRVFNENQVEVATVASPSGQAWVVDNQVYDMGNLTTGDKLYFAVDRDGDYSYDATEIVWTVKRVDIITEVQNKEQVMRVYPNPTMGLVHLAIEENWSVHSLLGTPLLTGEGTTINLSELPAGVYVIRTGNVVSKVIKQ